VRLTGNGVAPGVGLGPALLLERRSAPVFRLHLRGDSIDGEIARFHAAAGRSGGQLREIRERLSREVGESHAYVFDAQIQMLDDPMLRDRVAGLIRAQSVNAEWALRAVAQELHALFDSVADAYIRERRTDLDDVVGRVQLNLTGCGAAVSEAELDEEVVLVAEELTPSQAGELDWRRVVAIVTGAGSSTHHAAILARSLGIPAVAGIDDATERIAPGALVAVDGTRGEVDLSPAPALVRELLGRKGRPTPAPNEPSRQLASVTRDGVRVRLLANVELLGEAGVATHYGAEGIGLFRSEYLLRRPGRWPTEDEQVEVYARLLAESAGPVTIRTWDVGPEDFVTGAVPGPNPALGERAWRLLGRDRQPFLTQLRALLRAGLGGELRISLPFVGGGGDLDAALALLGEARDGLTREGVPFATRVPVGLNVEVPSAALTADQLARRVDFFSVGTNDLIQYLLAVDRGDPRMAEHFQALHPAVLRVLGEVAGAASRAGIGLGLCGEMAANPLHALLLVGLGFRELSMTPAAIPSVKAAIRNVRADAASDLARRCLELSSPEKVEAALRNELAGEAPAAVEE